MTERVLLKRARLRANHEGPHGCGGLYNKSPNGMGCLGCAARIPYPHASRMELLAVSRLAAK